MQDKDKTLILKYLSTEISPGKTKELEDFKNDILGFGLDYAGVYLEALRENKDANVQYASFVALKFLGFNIYLEGSKYILKIQDITQSKEAPNAMDLLLEAAVECRKLYPHISKNEDNWLSKLVKSVDMIEEGF